MDRSIFFNRVRAGLFGGKLTQSQVDGLTALLDAATARNWPIAYTAYGLATTYHETAATMCPLDEYGGNKYYTKMYDVQGIKPKRAISHGNDLPGEGIKYHGRGLVQITWEVNYKRLGAAIGVDLENNPDLALKMDVAVKILVAGMERGLFTGKKFADYLNGSKPDYVNARRIINGTDKAELIAGYARKFEDALKAAGQL